MPPLDARANLYGLFTSLLARRPDSPRPTAFQRSTLRHGAGFTVQERQSASHRVIRTEVDDIDSCSVASLAFYNLSEYLCFAR